MTNAAFEGVDGGLLMGIVLQKEIPGILTGAMEAIVSVRQEWEVVRLATAVARGFFASAVQQAVSMPWNMSNGEGWSVVNSITGGHL